MVLVQEIEVILGSLSSKVIVFNYKFAKLLKGLSSVGWGGVVLEL